MESCSSAAASPLPAATKETASAAPTFSRRSKERVCHTRTRQCSAARSTRPMTEESREQRSDRVPDTGTAERACARQLPQDLARVRRAVGGAVVVRHRARVRRLAPELGRTEQHYPCP